MGEEYLPPFVFRHVIVRAMIEISVKNHHVPRFKLVIVPGAKHLSAGELDAFRQYVFSGGTLLYSVGSYWHGFGGEELFGIEMEDFTLDPTQLELFKRKYRLFPVNWAEAGFKRMPVMKNVKAEVLARYKKSLSPALTINRYGKGKAIYLHASWELAMNEPYAYQSDFHRYLYRELLSEAGVSSPVQFTSPYVELHAFRFEGYDKYVLINHANADIQGTLIAANREEEQIRLERKSAMCITKEVYAYGNTGI